jgi:hypothetical protein
METEILLVDEVLAVGDAQFQKKCYEKSRQIRTGRRNDSVREAQYGGVTNHLPARSCLSAQSEDLSAHSYSELRQNEGEQR